MRTWRPLGCVVLALTSSDIQRAQQQAVIIKTLGAPTASFADPFSRVGGVREQSDGNVLVLDIREVRIVRVDFTRASATALGRSGRGPGEYTLPLSLVGLPGDTTLAVDMSGGGRALVITRDGVAASSIQSAGIDRVKPLFQSAEMQADARGRLYELVRRQTAGARQLAEDDGIRRLDRQTGRQDTIASVSRKARSPLIHAVAQRGASGNDGAALAGGAPPPFMTVDQWAVAPDGTIAIVSVEPYRVTYVDPSGKRTEGAPIAYAPIRVDNALKQRWRELKSQPVPTIRYGPNGSIAGGSSKPRFSEPTEWPDVLPPFLPDAVRFAPDGTLWVQRAEAATAATTFDLIDRTGRVTSQVMLPAHTRLVGFGSKSVYTVRIDSDDLEYLQQHARP